MSSAGHAIKAVIFDMDDTLYPEEQYVLSGFLAVARWAETVLGIPVEAGYRQLEGYFLDGVRNNTFNLFLSENGVAEDKHIPEMVKAYRQHQPKLTPFPEVDAVLRELAPFYQFGLISDGYLEVQQKKWQGLNLGYPFTAVIFSDKWGRESWKPSHHPYLEALKLLDCAAAEAAYIGDNPGKDFLGAKELGIYTIMVARKGGVYSHVTPPTSAHAADVTISDLGELPVVIGDSPR